jgi:hypothetical protein
VRRGGYESGGAAQTGHILVVEEGRQVVLRSRLQKTWQHIMEKSNKGLKDKLSVIEHETQ